MGVALGSGFSLAEFGSRRFDPSFGLDHLNRAALATLGREWLLHGHLQDRAGMPLFLAMSTREEMQRLAIDQWMLASPVYSKRMQHAMGFGGEHVATIFKNLQLDIGAPHQFMDFRYRLTDSAHGEFWLAHCGALMDVEPMGEDFVTGMCHDIEDPTFDATAAATSPFARVRPIHRPPRVPAGREPHCHWTVTIDPRREPAPAHPRLDEMRRSAAASVRLRAPEVESDAGMDDYSGAFKPDFVLEDLSRRGLVSVLAEFALQSHLLGRAYLMSLVGRVGPETALEMGREVLTGLAGMTAERLASMVAGSSDPLEAIAKLLQLHPIFHPRGYVDLLVDVSGSDRVGVRIVIPDQSREADGYSWQGCLEVAAGDVIQAVARAVDPRVRCTGEPPGDLELVLDPAAPASLEPRATSLIRLSTGAGFQFTFPAQP